ncbi:MAG: OmpA family protein [Actinomadura sp.]
MSGVRRAILLTSALVLATAVPSAAAAEPDVSDAGIAESVRDIGTSDAVRDIDLSRAVVPLETEETVGRQVTVRISADVLFDFGEATLTDAAKRRIARLAERLGDADGTVEVSGHTDSIGDDDSNMRLSEQRAEAVKAELERSLRNPSLKIEARGYGETRPVAPNERNGEDDPEGRAKNRRVDITYEKG